MIGFMIMILSFKWIVIRKNFPRINRNKRFNIVYYSMSIILSTLLCCVL